MIYFLRDSEAEQLDTNFNFTGVSYSCSIQNTYLYFRGFHTIQVPTRVTLPKVNAYICETNAATLMLF